MPINNKGENNPMYGKKHSDEAKLKISKKAKLRKLEKSSNWKGGTRISPDGYIEVLKREHHRARKNGYVFEHILVVEKKLGRKLKNGEFVHHINHNKTDNRPENLQVVTNSEHSKIHGEEKQRTGKYKKCLHCGKEFYCKPSHLKKRYCCSMSCHAKRNNFGKSRKVDVDIERLKVLLEKNKSAVEISKEMGISYHVIYRRIKELRGVC